MNEGRRDRTLFVVAALFLIFTVIQRLLPAHEVTISTLNTLTIVPELGPLTRVIGTVHVYLRATTAGMGRAGGSRGG